MSWTPYGKTFGEFRRDEAMPAYAWLMIPEFRPTPMLEGDLIDGSTSGCGCCSDMPDSDAVVTHFIAVAEPESP